ncbi:serpin family protein [Candidatus Woesearchaeota archaeon]|nr:serpin family protein [Candidatus Woesearchaeota archaeon]
MKQELLFGLLLMGVGLLVLGCGSFEPADDSLTTQADIDAVVAANNAFAIDFYQAMKAKGENLFFSPYSISTALAVTYEGAKGQTEEELQAVFHYPESKEQLRRGSAGVYNSINEPGKEYTLSTANALWAQESYPFLNDYLSTAKQYYAAEARNLDFGGDPDGSAKVINNWIERETNNKIKDAVDNINTLTRLIITNAVYFKGEWEETFKKKDTDERDFTKDDNTKVRVPLMSMTDEDAVFPYIEDDDVQVLEMPYKGDDMSMLVILPKENDIGAVESLLTQERIADWRAGLVEQRVDVYFPRFRFEDKYELRDALTAMGMPTAFTFDADLTGMAATEELFIERITHLTFIEVDEKGTEAAAVTIVRGMGKGMPMHPVFRADHPFLFLIQERETGLILFMGKVEDPTT